MSCNYCGQMNPNSYSVAQPDPNFDPGDQNWPKIGFIKYIIGLNPNLDPYFKKKIKENNLNNSDISENVFYQCSFQWQPL